MPATTKKERMTQPGDPGERITLLRKRLGLSQKALAALVGITPTTLSEIENGGDCRQSTLQRIAAHLHTTLASLYTPLV